MTRPVEAARAVDAKSTRPPLVGKLQNSFAQLHRHHRQGDISNESGTPPLDKTRHYPLGSAPASRVSQRKPLHFVTPKRLPRDKRAPGDGLHHVSHTTMTRGGWTCSRSRPGRTKQSATRIAHHARRRLGVLLGALAAASILIVLTAGGTPLAARRPSRKSSKATRAFVVDQQTGETRMPTEQEVDEVVANLAALGRPGRSRTCSSRLQASGAVVVDLDGGFNGVLLARPNGDGTLSETKCVFTLEEGAEFLGIVEDMSAAQ